MSDEEGAFSLKQTGVSYSKNDNDEVTVASDWEGTATGYGTVFGTLSVTFPFADAGAATGTLTWVSGAALEDGTSVAGIGDGTWQQVPGQHKWTVTIDNRVSNGDRLRGTGEIDLAARTFAGTFRLA